MKDSRPRGAVGATRVRLAALLVALSLPASACVSLGAFGAGELGPAVSGVDLSGTTLVVGSKEFTEQLILGQIAGQALTAAGAEVTDETGLVGTYLVRESLEAQAIDMYWEYTGTGWLTILGHVTPIDDDYQQWKAVHDEDLKANGVWWFPPADLNNSYGFALKESEARQQGVTSIADISKVPQSELSLCAAAEFLSRSDGLPGVEQAYGFSFPDSGISELDYGLIYPTIGTVCTYGEIFTTDGRILTEDLYVLEDTKSFFPKYNATLTMREETYQAEKDQFDKLFKPIIDNIDNDTMIELNGLVDVDGRAEEDVAHDFLVSIDVLAE